MTVATVLAGDCRELLPAVAARSVHLCLTSPPYYWQRDYGHPDQIGHEETPQGYAEAIAAVFRQVWRVLHPRGAVWLNLGDTYYSGLGQSSKSDPRCPTRDWMRKTRRAVDTPGWSIPRKSLLGMHWLVVHALQRDGWTVRQEVAWVRTTALPEPSAKDRPHRQHEYLFLLSRGPKYHFDRSALPEESAWHIPHKRQAGPGNGGHAAAMPEALAERCIASASRPGDTVLDPFLGTGTTLAVAERMGRRGLGMELNEDYARMARLRLDGAKPGERIAGGNRAPATS